MRDKMQTSFTIKNLIEFMNIKDDAKGEIFELLVWLTLKGEFELEHGETLSLSEDKLLTEANNLIHAINDAEQREADKVLLNTPEPKL